MSAQYHIGVEDMEPGNWVVWVFELPGCYARGRTREEAVALAPAAIDEMIERLNRGGYRADGAVSPVEVEAVEEFRAFPSSPDYLVNAFFEDDKRPLTKDDIAYAHCLLRLNRDELLSVVSDLRDAVLDREIPGEVQKNVRGIMTHIGTAEWWYWDRLGMAFPRAERPAEVSELLRLVRTFTLRRLPELVGSALTTTCSGEAWSPRKLLRRAVWHERVHTLQIKRYLSAW